MKKFIKLYYHYNSTHRILLGPMRGMLFRINEVTGLSPLYSGSERWHQRRFREIVDKDDTVIDIGANWGVHTLYLSKLIGKKGTIVSVEPFSSAFRELKWHSEVNLCTNVVAINVAICDFDGEVQLAVEHNGGQGIITSCAGEQGLLLEKEKVSTKTLDTLVNELGLKKIKLIKIDVEGAEDKVLKGAERISKEFRPYFIIDLHTPENGLFVGQWFIEKGYTLQRVDKSLPSILEADKGWPEKNGIWGSILAVP